MRSTNGFSLHDLAQAIIRSTCGTVVRSSRIRFSPSRKQFQCSTHRVIPAVHATVRQVPPTFRRARASCPCITTFGGNTRACQRGRWRSPVGYPSLWRMVSIELPYAIEPYRRFITRRTWRLALSTCTEPCPSLSRSLGACFLGLRGRAFPLLQSRRSGCSGTPFERGHPATPLDLASLVSTGPLCFP